MHAHFDILCFVLYVRLFWRTVGRCVFYACSVLLCAFFTLYQDLGGKRMKKVIMCIVSMLICVCFMLSGCTSGDNGKAPTEASTQAQTQVPTEAPTEKELDFNEAIANCVDNFKTNNLEDVYDCSYSIFDRFQVSADGRSMSIACGNSWDITLKQVLAAVECMNLELGFSNSLNSKIEMTRAIDGAQSEENDLVEVTWSYSSKSGLTVIYDKKCAKNKQ